jgi:hypothetical protein
MAEMVVKRMTSRIFALFSLDLSLVIVSVRVISNTICVLKIVWYLHCWFIAANRLDIRDYLIENANLN